MGLMEDVFGSADKKPKGTEGSEGGTFMAIPRDQNLHTTEEEGMAAERRRIERENIEKEIAEIEMARKNGLNDSQAEDLARLNDKLRELSQ